MTESDRQLDEIAEAERRIAFAFSRIEAVLPALALRTGAGSVATPPSDLPAETPTAETSSSADDSALQAELEQERATNAALSERVRLLGEKQETTIAALEKRLTQALRALEAAEAEADHFRRLNLDLTEANKILLQAEGDLTGPLVDMALRAELENLRAVRAAEAAEIGEIIAGIEPLIAAHHNDHHDGSKADA